MKRYWKCRPIPSSYYHRYIQASSFIICSGDLVSFQEMMPRTSLGSKHLSRGILGASSGMHKLALGATH